MSDTLANTNGKVREWIGPRIIPVFADEVQWDSTSNYEPLMMVQNAGETFMSRQYVPAGAPLPDTSNGIESTDYWVHMSNWNAQVEGYREEVMQYAQTVLTFEDSISALNDALPISDFDDENTIKSNIDTIKDDIDSIDSSITQILADSWVTAIRIAANAVITEKIADSAVTTAKIADSNITTPKIADSAVTTQKIANGTIKVEDLNTEVINEISTRKFILLGDSFGKGLYPTSGGYQSSSDGWLIFCKNVIEGRTNNKVYTNADVVQVGNHGFASSARFIDTIALVKNNIPNPNEITDIVVMAGTNDQNYVGNDLQTAITNFMNYCRDNFPNAQVKIGCLGTNLNGLQNVARDYRTCRAYGGVFISDVYGLLCLANYISSDETHLTSQGYTFYSRYLMQAVLTGTCPFSFFDDVTLTHEMLNSSEYYIPSGNIKLRETATERGLYLQLRPTSANVGGLNGMCIRDTSNNTAAKDITISFDWIITLPYYYEIITSDILRKFNTTQISNTYDLMCGARACMYTEPTGLHIITTAVNGYLPFDSVQWEIMFGQFFMPWIKYEN